VLHQLLEEPLPGVEGGRRRLGGLQLLALAHERPSSLDLVGLARGDGRGTGPVVGSSRGTVVAARATIVATRATVTAPLGAVVAVGRVGPRRVGPRRVAARGNGLRGDRLVFAARAAIVAPSRAVIAARGPVVAPRRAVIAARGPVVAARASINRRGEGRRSGGLTLRRGTAERRSGRCDNSGRLGAHAEDAPAARGQDLEIELVQANREFLASVAKGLLDGLAGELTVRTHAQRFLPRRP
jgi:hypothetical protein